MLYESDLPFGIDEVPEEKLRGYAREVAEIVVKEHVPEAVPDKENTKTAQGNSTRKNNKSSCCGN